MVFKIKIQNKLGEIVNKHIVYSRILYRIYRETANTVFLVYYSDNKIRSASVDKYKFLNECQNGSFHYIDKEELTEEDINKYDISMDISICKRMKKFSEECLKLK